LYAFKTLKDRIISPPMNVLGCCVGAKVSLLITPSCKVFLQHYLAALHNGPANMIHTPSHKPPPMH